MNRHLRYVLKGVFCSSLAFGLLFPAIAGAAGYLKFEGVKGESAAQGHSDEMVIESWSWGETNANSGMPSGKRQHKPLTITKALDKSSPIMREASSSGWVFPSVTLTTMAADGTSAAYKLTNVIVSSYQTSGGAAGTLPMESFSLSYEKIKEPYGQGAITTRKQE